MNTPIDLVIATTNEGKMKEINSILNSNPKQKFNLTNLTAYAIAEPDEPFETCLENAVHKAKYYAAFTQQPTLSEDAGLFIEALNGFPGVHTKEFAVESGTMQQAFKTLANMLEHKNNLRAYFICAAVLYNPLTKELLYYEGKTPGTLCFPARGGNGFGFDPVFIPEGYTQTMAELGEAVKNEISHRAIAIRGLVEKIFNT